MSYKLQPADVQEKWEEYRMRCDTHIATLRYRDKLVQVPKPIIYSLQGFCLFLDLSEDELERFEKNKNYKAIFKKIRFQVMCRKMAALVNGEGNARALIFDLKVNHGIDPKQAREETDWKITLNLNHDNADPFEVQYVSQEDRRPGSRSSGAEEEDDAMEEEAPVVNEGQEEPGSTGDRKPGYHAIGTEEETSALPRLGDTPAADERMMDKENPTVSTLPPSPRAVKTGVYSIW